MNHIDYDFVAEAGWYFKTLAAQEPGEDSVLAATFGQRNKNVTTSTHLLPFFGRAHVAYLPSGKVVGLSKIPRIIDMFSRRLQVQERLTRQIAETVMDILDPVGAAVIMEGQHMCMQMRGVEKQNSLTTTSSMLGKFRESDRTRTEFLSIIGLNRK